MTQMATMAFEESEHSRLAEHMWLVAKRGVDTSSEAYERMYAAVDGPSLPPDKDGP